MAGEEEPDQPPKRSLTAMFVGLWHDGRNGRVTLLVWAVLVVVGLVIIGQGVVGILTKAR